jgi:hypothetical protein
MPEDAQTSPRDVLDAHVSLFRLAQVRAPVLAGPITRHMREITENSTVPRMEALRAEYGAARVSDELVPVSGEFACGEIAKALFDARTYQVTAEMSELACQLAARDASAGWELAERELPHPWGFLWLDEPIDVSVARSWKPDDQLPVVPVRAIIWATAKATRNEPRSVDLYTFTDDPSNPGCPLVPAGPMWLIGFGNNEHLQGNFEGLASRQLLMLWRLIDMEITDVRRQRCEDRQLAKQARRSIRHGEVNVVTLRRPSHREAPTGREVSWSCAWIVRGHMRRYAQPIRTGPNAGQTQVWIKPYIKGPDGAPLKSSEVLYLLKR